MLKSRFLRIILALSLVLCFTPAPAFAAEDEAANAGTPNAQAAGDLENASGAPANAEGDASEAVDGTVLPVADGGAQAPVEDMVDDQSANDTAADNAVKRNGEADDESVLAGSLFWTGNQQSKETAKTGEPVE